MDIDSEIEKMASEVKTRKHIEEMIRKILHLERENNALKQQNQNLASFSNTHFLNPSLSQQNPSHYKDDGTINVNMTGAEGVYTAIISGSTKTLVDCPTRKLIVSDLQKLRHEHVARVDGVVNVNMKDYVMVEELEPVEDFFERKKVQYKNANNGVVDNIAWYKYAEPDFLNIFGGVADAMIWLYQKGFTCSGNMQSCIFVDGSNNGIVLPSSKSSGLHNGDFNSFCRILGKILDIEESKVDFHNDDRYSYELRSLLDYNKGYGVSDYWLFSHPIFWDTTKRVSFIHGVDSLRSRDRWFSTMLEEAMFTFPEREIKDQHMAWKNRIPHTSKLHQVFYLVDSNQLQSPQQSESLSYPSLYVLPVGITRFARNCMMHLPMTCDAIDKELRRIFPHYHTWVYDSILKIKNLPHRAVPERRFNRWTGPSNASIFF